MRFVPWLVSIENYSKFLICSFYYKYLALKLMKLVYSLGLLLVISLLSQEIAFERKLSDAAITLTKDTIVYDGNCVSIKIPTAMFPPMKAFARM
jgi:hypothetical protein